MTNPDTSTANSEAAKYRVRLREAEAQRDALAAKLTEHETAEKETAAATARTEHATRIGTPSIAEHLTGDTPEELAADADRLTTITRAALPDLFAPGSTLSAAAAELINDKGEATLSLTDALHLAGQLPSILAEDDPATALKEFTTAHNITITQTGGGPFVGHHLPGIRREISSGDIPKSMSIGEAMKGMF